MSAETTLYGVLAADAGVTALAGTRIYPLLLPQEPTLPAITYQRISTTAVHTRSGNGLAFVRLQLDCFAATYAGAKSLAAAVVAAVETVDGAQQQQMLDGYDDSPEQFRVTIDFIFNE